MLTFLLHLIRWRSIRNNSPNSILTTLNPRVNPRVVELHLLYWGLFSFLFFSFFSSFPCFLRVLVYPPCMYIFPFFYNILWVGNIRWGYLSLFRLTSMLHLFLGLSNKFFPFVIYIFYFEGSIFVMNVDYWDTLVNYVRIFYHANRRRN